VADVAIDVQDVSKRFRLYSDKATSFKERVVHAGRVVHEDLWALRDVSFSVPEGQTLGILGRNGSGKSTLLKCICGVLQPTAGRVVVRGTLAGLLELGAGFQQDLSGRDNIYLNGLLLGLSRREVQRRFDEIVEFAELERFIDNQVKFYSSGMYVRLGFAVAVATEPDILVVDEVLSVGDERFQRKCLDRVRRFQDEGRTIVLVTHSPDEVRSICDQALVIQGGTMVALGAPETAVVRFREELLRAGDTLPVGGGRSTVGGDGAVAASGEGEGAVPPPDQPADGAAAAGITTPLVHPEHPAPTAASTPTAVGGRVHLESVRITDPAPPEPVRARGRMTVVIDYRASAGTPGVTVRLDVRDEEGALLFRTDRAGDLVADLPPGPGSIRLDVDDMPFLSGAFSLHVGLQSRLGGTIYDWREHACTFRVHSDGDETGQIAMSTTVVRIG